jgi:hypothetical protein
MATLGDNTVVDKRTLKGQRLWCAFCGKLTAPTNQCICVLDPVSADDRNLNGITERRSFRCNGKIVRYITTERKTDRGLIEVRMSMVCSECYGTGWTCSTCGKPGNYCSCCGNDEQAIDCQACQGTGEADAN